MGCHVSTSLPARLQLGTSHFCLSDGLRLRTETGLKLQTDSDRRHREMNFTAEIANIDLLFNSVTVH